MYYFTYSLTLVKRVLLFYKKSGNATFDQGQGKIACSKPLTSSMSLASIVRIVTFEFLTLRIYYLAFFLISKSLKYIGSEFSRESASPFINLRHPSFAAKYPIEGDNSLTK